METSAAVRTLAALAQPARLDMFRILVRQEPEGLNATDLSWWMHLPHEILAEHLAVLTSADLVTAEDHGGSKVYRARPETIGQLAVVLLQDYNGGQVGP